MIRFSLFGFPVAIHWMFWVTCALLGGGTSANTPAEFRRLIAWVIAALVSILIHELGHAFLQRRYGGRAQIMLVALGGLAIADRSFPRQQQIMISLAGPVVQIVVGLLAKQLLNISSGDSDIVVSFLHAFYVVSVFWGIFNLLPIYPMDGGKVLLNFLGPRMEKVTYTIGIIGAGLLALLALNFGQIFTTIILGMMAFENYQRLRGERTAGMLYPN